MKKLEDMTLEELEAHDKKIMEDANKQSASIKYLRALELESRGKLNEALDLATQAFHLDMEDKHQKLVRDINDRLVYQQTT